MNISLAVGVSIRCVAAFRYRKLIHGLMQNLGLQSREPWIADGVIVRKAAQKSGSQPEWLKSFERLQRSSVWWFFGAAISGVAATLVGLLT